MRRSSLEIFRAVATPLLLITNAFEVALVRPAAAATKVKAPFALSFRSLKVATPFTTCWVTVPVSTPVAGRWVMLIRVALSMATKLLPLSKTRTVSGAGPAARIFCPLPVAVGCASQASFAGIRPAASTRTFAERAPATPAAEAPIWQFFGGAAAESVMSLKVAIPLTTVRATVPPITTPGQPSALSVTVSELLFVTRVPAESSTRTVGCASRTVPVVVTAEG